MPLDSKERSSNMDNKASSGRVKRSKSSRASHSTPSKKLPELTPAEKERLLIQYVYSSASEPELSEDNWGEDGEFEVEKIVDEVVDMAGKHKYKVQWANWKRKSDGTNTTWIVPSQLGEGAEKTLKDWEIEKRAQIIKRREQFEATGGYPIKLFGHGCVTRFNTTLMELGLLRGQNIDIPSTDPKEIPDWDAEVAAVKAQAEAWIARNKGKSRALPEAVDDDEIQFIPDELVSPQTLPSSQRFREPLKWKTQLNQKQFRENGRQNGTSSHLHAPKRAFNDEQESDDLEPLVRHRHKRRHMTDAMAGHTIRDVLQAKWDQATEKARAASITIVNEIDDESIPNSINPELFEYAENGPYRWDGPSQDDYIFGCNCDRDCKNAPNCECQQDDFASAQHDALGRPIPAYNSKGLYQLHARSTVVECNAKCSCDITCRNRVAQRPRDIPLEIFKSRNHGWAVRATVLIPQGKVLGLFMGDLVDQDGTKDTDWMYSLDWHDSTRWRVSSEFYGNWSRFLNHSCYPNLQVYAVIFDSVRGSDEDDRHRLAFVATKDIPPRTELTVNYYPPTNIFSPISKKKKCCKFGGCIE